MKRFASFWALAALAACSDIAPGDEAAEGRAAKGVAGQSWLLQPGTYEFTRSDGMAGITVMVDDGTFSNAVIGGEIETGTWMHERGLTCLSARQAQEQCYAFTAPDASGKLTGKSGGGLSVTLRKLD